MNIRVTDHALLRYLERVHGIDMQAARNCIAETCREAAALGASGVQHDGFIYMLEGTSVLTVLKRGQFPKNRARRDSLIYERLADARPTLRQLLDDQE